VVPWSLDVSADLAGLLDDGTRGGQIVRHGLLAMGQQIREAVFLEVGVPLPPLRVRVQQALAPRHAVVSLFEVPARVLSFPHDLPDDAVVETVRAATTALVRTRAADYVGISETQQLLDELEQLAPALVRQVVPKPVTLGLLSDVLRRLAEEGVSIRDLRAILEALATVAATEKDPLALAEFVRSQLRRAITFHLTDGRPELSVYLLEPAIEDAIRHAVTRTAAGSFLTLAPAAARDVVGAVRRAVAPADAVRAPVVLTQPDIRRFVRKLLETDLPNVTVVSFAELLPEIALRPQGKATITSA
jgi:type III secretion protein V